MAYVAPTARTISWQQWVLEADPEWSQSYNRPWIYEMSNGRLFYQTAGYYLPLPPADLVNNSGTINLVTTTGWPTSAKGLSVGQTWANGLAINVVLPVTPYPHPMPVFFAGLTAFELQESDTRLFPQSIPATHGLVWINAGVFSVS